MILATRSTDSVDAAFLLYAYMICADAELHSDEIAAVRTAAESAKVSDATMVRVAEILRDTADKVPVDEALIAVPPSRRLGVLKTLVHLAWADKRLVDEERAFLRQCAEAWDFSEQVVLDALASAAVPDTSPTPTEPEQHDLSVRARLVSAADRLMGGSSVDLMASLLHTSLATGIARARRECLLAGSDYDDAIDLCARIASEDFTHAEGTLRAASQTLVLLQGSVDDGLDALEAETSRREARHARELTQVIEQLRHALDTDVTARLEDLRAHLRARARALGTFTIAFMGRTKAGKSTLHAVITGEGWEAIGVGRQRTTRFNRVYEWRRVRIVDTPGIGAPGGRTDEEVARSIIDEADVVCYVLTDDSQQASEFRFLSVLRERLKPLIILLNVKSNLTDDKKRARFLRRPDRTFREEGTNGIRGHAQRIRRFAKEHYGTERFPIIPVQLLAAQLARQPEHAEEADALHEASRMDDFLDQTRVSILQHGALRRSHNLLGSTALDLHRAHRWVEVRQRKIAEQRQRLDETRARMNQELRRFAVDAIALFESRASAAWSEVRSSITPFAEDHWNLNKKRLNDAWATHLTELELERRLSAASEDAATSFQANAAEVLSEVGKEIELTAGFATEGPDLEAQDRSTLLKDLLRFAPPVAAIALTIVSFFTPVGWAAWIALGVGSVATAIGGYFLKSRDHKRRKAVQRISEALQEELAAQQGLSLEQGRQALREATDGVNDAADLYFATMDAALERVQAALENAAISLEGQVSNVTRRYAARVLHAYEGRVEAPVEPTLDTLVAQAFDGASLSLTLDRAPEGVLSLDELADALQIPVTIREVRR